MPIEANLSKPFTPKPFFLYNSARFNWVIRMSTQNPPKKKALVNLPFPIKKAEDNASDEIFEDMSLDEIYDNAKKHWENKANS